MTLEQRELLRQAYISGFCEGVVFSNHSNAVFNRNLYKGNRRNWEENPMIDTQEKYDQWFNKTFVSDLPTMAEEKESKAAGI